ncbi:MAG: hypothetical protein HRU15_08435 [Planctomycetes bacterium]|nr:hypothetical protein [Planctomycetota bacterium]
MFVLVQKSRCRETGDMTAVWRRRISDVREFKYIVYNHDRHDAIGAFTLDDAKWYAAHPLSWNEIKEKDIGQVSKQDLTLLPDYSKKNPVKKISSIELKNNEHIIIKSPEKEMMIHVNEDGEFEFNVL